MTRQYTQAAKEYSTAVQLAPNRAEYAAALGNLALATDDRQTAENSLKRALQLNPSLGEAHRDLGILYKRTGRLTESIEQLRTAAQELPADASTHFVLGQALEAAGQSSEARRQFEITQTLTGLVRQKTLANAEVNVGAQMLEAGQFDEAEAEAAGSHP